MDSLTQSVTELSGSVGALMNELRRADNRIRTLEERNRQPPTPVVIPLRGPSSEDDLKEIGRLPDSVKELQVFEGDPSQYVSWIHTVEGILDDYKIVRGKPLFRAILKSVRGKIRGSANSALISHNIFDDDWPAIKSCLSLHYADKRDIRTLEHQLGQLTQGGSKLDEFYAKVNHQFSLIINKLKTESYSSETVSALMETYRNRALDVFIRGLSADLSRMIIVQKPQSLPEAYTACLDIQNLNYRNHPIHHVNTGNSVTVPTNMMSRRDVPPNLPPRRPITFRSSGNNRFNQRPREYHHVPRNTTSAPVERMDVDPTVQTRKINYMNRPQHSHQFKRKFESDNFRNSKQQKMFNIETGNNNDQRRSYNYTQHDSYDQNMEQQANFMDGAYPAYLI